MLKTLIILAFLYSLSFVEAQTKSGSQNPPSFPMIPIKKFIITGRAGANVFHGDVANITKAHFGVDLIKPIGYGSYLRSSFVFGKFAGQNEVPNTVIAGSILDNLGYTNIYYNNFETQYINWAFQLKLDINNIGFFEEPFFKLYGFFGPAFFLYIVSQNLLDDNGQIYDFSGDIKKVEFDDTYETLVTMDDFISKNVQPVPILTIGMGMDFRISTKFTLGFEYTIHTEMLYKSDLWDGSRYQESANVLSPDYDGLSSFSTTFSYKIGPTLTTLVLETPMEVNADDFFEMKKRIQELTLELSQDSDNDGVPDVHDQELNSPPGAIVGVNGVTLDSDRDGIPDYRDIEPFSPFPDRVDINGATILTAEGIPVYLKEWLELLGKE